MHAVVFHSLIRKHDKLPIIEGDYGIYMDNKKLVFAYKNEILFQRWVSCCSKEDEDISDIETKKELRFTMTKMMRLSEVISCLDITLEEDEIIYFFNDYTPMHLSRDGNDYKIYYYQDDYPSGNYFEVLKFSLTDEQIEVFSKDQVTWYKYIMENLL